MDGGSHSQWGLNSVMCHSGGTCVFGHMFGTSPGSTVVGTMQLVSTHPQNCWNVTTTDMTTSNANTIQYCTSYMITWAFLALEHNPVGGVGSCNTLPTGSIDFSNNVAKPTPGVWQGALGNDAGCGISVDTFPIGDTMSIAF